MNLATIATPFAPPRRTVQLMPEKLEKRAARRETMPPPIMPPKNPVDTDVEQLLKSYIREGKEQNERREEKENKILEMLEKSHDWQLEHHAADERHFAELKGDIKSLSLRMASVESDVDKLEQNFEDTGRHNLSKLELELERQRVREEKRKERQKEREYETAQWLRRNWIPTLITVLSLAWAIYSTFHK